MSARSTPLLLDSLRLRGRAVSAGGSFDLLLTASGYLIPVGVCLYLADLQPLFQVGNADFMHADLVLVVLGLVVFARSLFVGFHSFPRTFLVPLLFLFLSTLLSASFAKDNLRAAAAVVQMAEFAILAWCFSLVASERTFLRILHFILGWFAFETGVATWQFLTGEAWPHGTFLVHQQYAMFTGFSAAIAFGLLAAEGDRSRRFIYLGLLGVLLWGTLLGQERAPWLAFILGSAAVVYYSRKNRVKLFLFFGVVLVSAVLLVALVPQLRDMTLSRLAEAQTTSERSNSLLARLAVWGVAGKLFLEHPVLGVGPKNFYALAPHLLTIEEMMGEEAVDPHNIWIGILAEQGIVGFATYVWFSVAVLLLVVRMLRSPLTPRLRGLCFAYLAYNVFWFVMSYHYFQKGEGHFHFMLIGLLIGQYRLWQGASDEALRFPHPEPAK